MLIWLVFQVAQATLAFHYKFWESYDQGFQDFSGHGNIGISGTDTGVNSNDVIPTARGAYFSGTSLVKAPPNAAVTTGMQTGNSFSMSCWILSFASQNLMLEKAGIGGSTFLMRYRMILSEGTNIFRLRITSGGVDFYADSTVGVPLNVWTYLTVTVQCTTTCIVLGYRELTQLINATSPPITYVDSMTDTLIIGQGATGFIYEFQFYPYVLLLSDISNHFTSPGSGGCSGSCSSVCVVDPSTMCLSTCTSVLVTLDCSTACSWMGQMCDPYCATCSGASSNQCLTWSDPNTPLVAGVCSCVSSYYLSSSNPFTCTACDNTCATCTSVASTACNSCKSNASLVGFAPSNCQCDTGWWPNPNSGSCSICAGTCQKCNNGTANGCTGCFANAQLVSGSPSACVCSSGYDPSSDASNCVLCHITCLTCNGTTSSSCMTCKSIAQLSGSAPSSCICPSNSYPNPDSRNCPLCDTQCLTCSGGAASQCASCKANASLSGSSPNSCACIGGYYPAPNPSSCLACDSTCLICAAAGSSQCSSCKLNAHLSASAPCSCLCDDGFYPSLDSSNCLPCDLTCLTCTGGMTTSCITCKTDASLVTSGANINSCACNDGFYPAPDSSNCPMCDSTCGTCNGVSTFQCSGCHTNAGIKNNGALGQCICNLGFYPNPTSASCLLCDNTCFECISFGPSKCITCKNFAKLSGSSPSTCECGSDAFPSPDVATCRLCDITCLSCSMQGALGCSSCKSGAYLSGPAPAACQCNPGFYPNPDPSTCSLCAATCASCVNSSECKSCKDNAILNDTACECLAGFYWSSDALSCVACTEGCKMCLSSSCVICESELFSWNQQCVATCPKGYQGTGTFQCEAIDVSPPIPTLTVNSDNNLHVTFDKPMNCSLTASDVSVDVQDSNERPNAVSWTDPNFRDAETMFVNITLEASYAPVGSTVNLTFLSVEKVKDKYGISMNVSSVKGSLNPYGNPPSNQSALLLQTTTAQQTAAATKGGIAAGVATSLITGNPLCLASLINQLQLISYISMTELPIPQEFASALAALNVGNMLPNPVSSLISSNETSQTAPQYAKDYGINSTFFIVNSVSFIGVSGAIIMSFLPVYLLSKVKIRFIRNYCAQMLPTLRWNVPVTLWLTSYLDIGIFSLLQLLNARDSVSSVLVTGSLLLAGLFALCVAVTPILAILFTYRNFDLMSSRSDSQFNQRWGCLFLRFKDTHNFFSLAYYSFFIIRRLVLVLTLTLGHSNLGLLALLNSSVGFLVMTT